MSKHTEPGPLRKDLPDGTKDLLDALADLAFSSGSKREYGPVCWCCPTTREQQRPGDLPRYVACRTAACKKARAAFIKAKYRDTHYEFGDLAVGLELEAQTITGEWRRAKVVKLERAGTLDVAWISWVGLSFSPGDRIKAYEMKTVRELRPIGGGAC